MATKQERSEAARTLGSKGGRSKSPAKLAGLEKARAALKAKRDAEALQLAPDVLASK